MMKNLKLLEILKKIIKNINPFHVKRCETDMNGGFYNVC